MAPPGTRVVIHETPAQRATFAPHGIEGWYVGPSLEHYRCYKCYLPSHTSCRDALTVDWFPHRIPFPKVDTDTYLRQTAEDMLTLFKSKDNPIPNLSYGSALTNAYVKIAKLLQRTLAPPSNVSSPPASPQRVPLVPSPAAPKQINNPGTTANTSHHGRTTEGASAIGSSTVDC